MSEYRRSREGSAYFFTVVTCQREHFLGSAESVNTFEEILNEVKLRHSFEVEACVILPDHIHAIWRLFDGDVTYSMLWGYIKKEFSKRMKDKLPVSVQTSSRLRHRESMVWQRRFWEHQIRDEKDFQAHFDYIHFNPVKHGLVHKPDDWQFSTFHKHVDSGIYSKDWGSVPVEFNEGVGRE
ncbi:REP-associated tyrosine transposase [Methylophilaceae bacterium]|nr:REP-associated tyrosine transposase [Methylophilaceae bacterium]